MENVMLNILLSMSCDFPIELVPRELGVATAAWWNYGDQGP